MRLFAGLTGTLLLFFVLVSTNYTLETPEWNDSTRLSKVLTHFGETSPAHAVGELDDRKVELGKQLITQNRYESDGGGKSKYQSIHYNCTSCHNIVREDADLTISDPNARLHYAIQKDLPFLQGTTLYGTVNKRSWYNDDYYEKYGEAVQAARNDLPVAIQLCATECSQGRQLNDRELDFVLHYLWSIEYRLGDLDLTPNEWNQLKEWASSSSNANDQKALDLLKSKYLTFSPATFGTPPDDKSIGYGVEGDRSLGAELFQRSCLHCHHAYGESSFYLDDSPASLRFLSNNMQSSTIFSLYEAVRTGTKAEYGAAAYMPHYTEERMSNAQIEHLRSYISSTAQN